MKFRVAVMLLQRVERQPFENCSIIFRGHRLGHHQQRVHALVHTCLVIENCAIQLFLGGEMPKYHCLGNAGRRRNFLRRRAAESALRKQAHGHAQNLQPPIFAGHPGAVCAGRVNCLLCLQSELGPL